MVKDNTRPQTLTKTERLTARYSNVKSELVDCCVHLGTLQKYEKIARKLVDEVGNPQKVDELREHIGIIQSEAEFYHSLMKSLNSELKKYAKQLQEYTSRLKINAMMEGLTETEYDQREGIKEKISIREAGVVFDIARKVELQGLQRVLDSDQNMGVELSLIHTLGINSCVEIDEIANSVGIPGTGEFKESLEYVEDYKLNPDNFEPPTKRF